ncbi:MAG: hypothetical protein H7831_10205 [Magnetococcus sp. WYHC-3]
MTENSEILLKFQQTCATYFKLAEYLKADAIGRVYVQLFDKLPEEGFDTDNLKKLISIKNAADEFRRRHLEVPSEATCLLTILKERDVPVAS